MKKLFTLGAMLIALATAGPALADHGQSADHSVLTVQLGSGNVSPAASANAPANVDAPVCVAGICSSQAGPQENDGASASTNGGSGSGSSGPADQSGEESIGTVQIGSATVDPAAAVSAPVNANAPVCVAATCSSSSGGQQAGSTSATTSSAGQSQSGNQSAHESIGTVQIGSATVDPAAAVSAPVNANAPVCILASCSSASSGQQAGTASATTNDAGQSQPGNQSAHESIGTVQIGSATVDPAAAVSAPMDANAPVCLLSACRSTAGAHSADGGTGSGGSGTGSAGGGGDAGGGGSEAAGGGSTRGDTTGDEPGQLTPLTPPQTGPMTAVRSTGAAAEAPALPKATSPAEGRSGTAAAGGGVLGTGAETSSSAGAETATVQPVIAKGQLPFSGLALARDLVLGLALMLVGLFTWVLSASEGRRRL
jgi:hypothetical protein